MAGERLFGGLGAVFAFLAVALGAFGAHALRGHFAPVRLDVWETAVHYQMYHALGLFAAAWACSRWPGRAARGAGWLLVVGIVLFSGSLYLLVLTGQRWLGFITPFGGLAFLGAWALLAWTLLND
jgi:uncharacterized membrane protein YgdD (TMEM256/DUF423 family)